jgi:hypothetical protein
MFSVGIDKCDSTPMADMMNRNGHAIKDVEIVTVAVAVGKDSENGSTVSRTVTW